MPDPTTFLFSIPLSTLSFSASITFHLRTIIALALELMTSVGEKSYSYFCETFLECSEIPTRFDFFLPRFYPPPQTIIDRHLLWVGVKQKAANTPTFLIIPFGYSRK